MPYRPVRRLSSAWRDFRRGDMKEEFSRVRWTCTVRFSENAFLPAGRPQPFRAPQQRAAHTCRTEAANHSTWGRNRWPISLITTLRLAGHFQSINVSEYTKRYKLLRGGFYILPGSFKDTENWPGIILEPDGWKNIWNKVKNKWNK